MSRNYEKHLTSTNEEISLGNKTLLVMLINSILTPMLINMIYKENIYGVDGLAEDVFYFALTNAILSIFLKIFNISFIFNRLGAWYSNWTCKKWKTTQRLITNMLPLKREFNMLQWIFLIFMLVSMLLCSPSLH